MQAQNVATTTPAVDTPVPGKPSRALSDDQILVREIRANLCGRFAEREAEVQGLLVAALAGEHTLLIGPPGTGKSALARAFADTFAGASYFETLLTRFSTPEEVFGPVSLSGLKTDRYTRVTAGKLPTAHVAFLDEIFKANSAILNACLTALNERIFHDDGKPVGMPLLTCVGASNELPEGQDLAALWDRFVVRYFVAYTKREDSFALMLSGGTPAPMRGVLTLDRWRDIQAQVDAVQLPPATVAALFRLRTALAVRGVESSDRRWVKAARLLRAQAWLGGSSVATSAHFGILTACLWNTPDQAAAVREEVSKYAGADMTRARKMFDAVMALVNDLRKGGGTGWVEQAGQARAELKKAADRLIEIQQATMDSEEFDQLEQMIGLIRETGTALTSQIKVKIGLDV